MTEAEFRKKLTNEGYAEVREVEWEADKLNESHAHDFTAHGLVLSGQFELTANGEVQVFGPGDTFFMAAGNTHQERTGPQGATLLVGRK